MKNTYHYETITEAINELRKKGYTLDFNLEENFALFQPGKFQPGEYEITEIYRYEGDTDPADEATVYGIQSKSGIKGILVTGYGIATDNFSSEILNRIRKS